MGVGCWPRPDRLSRNANHPISTQLQILVHNVAPTDRGVKADEEPWFYVSSARDLNLFVTVNYVENSTFNAYRFF